MSSVQSPSFGAARKGAQAPPAAPHKDQQEPVRNSLSTVKVAGGKQSQALMRASMGHPRAGGLARFKVDLPPLARVCVSAAPQIFTASQALAQGTATYVADPTGMATNSMFVQQWSTRFIGFQQYRIVKTEWTIVPLRTNIGVSTSSQASGVAIAWIENNPQSGASGQSNAIASLPRVTVALNSDRTHTVTYTADEPQDLNLTDINLAPTHLVGDNFIESGQHCLQIYTDNGFFGLDVGTGSGTVQLLYVGCIYDIEFYGIGGV